MSENYKDPRIPAQQSRGGLSVVTESSLRIDRISLSRTIVRCAECFQLTEHTGNYRVCGMCGARLSAPISQSIHPLRVPDLVTGHESYSIEPQRQNDDPRIPCRNVRACIKTEEGSTVMVNLLNISRGGVCFISDEEFYTGTPVSIATHYIEGGQNIYQDGRIIRVQRKPSSMLPGEYAVEFTRKQRLNNMTDAVQKAQR